jgi:hypothetical protein
MILTTILAASLAGAVQQKPPEPPPKAEPPKPVALVGGILHTMVAGSKPAAGTIVISGGRIQAVGPSVDVPADALKLDVSGKHVIPGLVDAMVNHDPDHDRLYATSGVTLVRDIGNDLARVLAERDKEGKSGARDRGPGPAILTAGAVLDGVPPSTTAAIVLDTPEAAADKIARLLQLEPDFLSFYSGLKEPVWRKVIEIGHAGGLQVWGPRLPSVDAARIAAAGQDGLYHLEAFLPAGKGWTEVALEDLRPAIEVLAARKIAITPTLSVFAQRLVQPKDPPPELAYLSPMYVQSWVADAGVRGKLMTDDKAYFSAGLKVVELQGKLVGALFERGATIVPGSASPSPWIFPGEGLANELGMLARAGIPKATVLRLATAGAAHALGVDKDRGTIEAGKVADLVVLSADPEADLGALHAPETVVLRGHVLDRVAMDALRKDLADTQKRLQADAFKPLSVPDPPIPDGDVLLRGTAETRGLGQRIRGESFAVVRAPDKSLVYTSRVLFPGSASVAGNDVEARQTVRDGALVGFEVKIKSAGRLVLVQGTQAGGYMNVERRLDGTFQGNLPVRERLSFVDTGSVTAEIAMGQLASEGKFKVLYFEDLDPAVGNWEMHVDKAGVHVARTPAGAMRVRYAHDGSVEKVEREEGSSVTTTVPVSIQSSNGGLAVPEKKKG